MKNWGTDMKNKKIIIPIIAAAVVLALGITILALGSTDNGLTGNNIYVLEADVGNKTLEDATEIITKEYMEADPKLEITCKGEKTEINFSDFGQIDFDETAKRVFETDRGNLLKRAYYKATSFIKREFPLSVVINEKDLNKKINEAFAHTGKTYVEEKYKISEDKLIVTAGRSGEVIEIENIQEVIESLALNQNITLEAVSTYKEYKGVDVDALYEKVCTQPKDAYYDKEGGKVIPHVLGYSFDKEEAKKVFFSLKEEEEAEINLEIKMPKVLDADLTGKMFKDVLASYSTNYNPGEVDRTYNMFLAARKVNGTVLEPEAVFSYNGVVGPRTVAAGYRNAKIFENGRVVDGLAGGICQVSSTIYNAALYSNMEIIERKNHSFPVAYTPKGQDATVSMGVIDFRFKNTYKRPVKITATVSGGSCRVEILGIKEENLKVEIVNNIVSQRERPVKYEEDPEMEKGKEKVVQTGNDGYTVTTYRKVYINGELIKTEKMPTSYYTPLEKIIKRNTEEETEEPPVTEPDPNAPPATEPQPEVPPVLEPQPETPPVVEPNPETPPVDEPKPEIPQT